MNQREIKFRFWDGQTISIPGRGIPFSILKDKNFIPMQFTGLKDKNGKEIYEGDIVRYTVEHPERKGEFHKRDWEIKDIRNLPVSLEFSEVIGNIYENPELLKV